MYLPKHFAEPRVGVMHDLIRAQPFATLVTHSSGGVTANHIPLLISEDPQPLGTLQGHVARANPLWKDVSAGGEVLAVFHGPHRYISPSWYATKKETGKVVPTWNYVVVHAYGTLRTVEDRTWLRALVERLTLQNESGNPEAWKVSDAPDHYVTKMLDAIVGVEIAITRLEGKWKVSQNQPAANRASVVEALQRSRGPDDALMAALIADAAKNVS